MAKFTYEIAIPNSGTYEVESDRELTDAQAYTYALQQASQTTTAPPVKEDTSPMLSAFKRGMDITARAVAPTAVGASVGQYFGGAPAALAGSVLVPAADVVGSVANLAMSPFTDYRLMPTSQGLQNLMTRAGFTAPPEEQTPTERVLSTGLETMTSVGKQVPALAKLATTAGTQGGRELAGRLATDPTTQAVVAPVATMAGQSVYELTNNPIASFLTTLGTSLLGIKRPKTQQAVSEDAMGKIAQERYDALDQMGFKFKNDAFVADMNDVAKNLRAAGYTPKGFPKIAGAIEELTSSTQPKDWTELQALRKIIRSAQKSTDPDEKRLGSILLDRFDNYLMNVDATKVETGNTKVMSKTWGEARDAYSKMKKSEIFTDMLEDAKLDATKYTQSGAENSMAAQLRQLAKNDKRMAMFTAEERDAIKKAAKGDVPQNLLRFFGKFAPTGAITGGTTAGAIYFDPVTGVAIGATTMASRAGATQYRMGTIEELANQMRTGSKPVVTGSATRVLPALATQAVTQSPSLFNQMPAIDILRERRIREMQQSPTARGLFTQ
jgi:uncharacterized membrane protein